MKVCPRSGCALPTQVLPTQAYDDERGEELKTCPKCRLAFWAKSGTTCIPFDFYMVAPLALPYLREVCQNVAGISAFWMHPVEFADLTLASLDMETRWGLKRRGQLASFVFRGNRVTIWTRDNIPPGAIYATRAPTELPMDWVPGPHDKTVGVVSR